MAHYGARLVILMKLPIVSLDVRTADFSVLCRDWPGVTGKTGVQRMRMFRRYELRCEQRDSGMTSHLGWFFFHRSAIGAARFLQDRIYSNDGAREDTPFRFYVRKVGS